MGIEMHQSQRRVARFQKKGIETHQSERSIARRTSINESARAKFKHSPLQAPSSKHGSY